MSATDADQTPEEIERGLSEGTRFSLARAYNGYVCADAGEGHTLNALRRRRLIPQREEPGGDPAWCAGRWGEWGQRLTPLGEKVAELAKVSTRPGGGKGKRGPRS